MVAFNGWLYAGTWTWDFDANSSPGGQLWRSNNGTAWSEVPPSGIDANDAEIFKLVVFKNMLYASTWAGNEIEGAEIWRSASGAAGTWNKVVDDGFGNPLNAGVLDMVEYNNVLYAATYNNSEGGSVYRSANGTSWTPVATGGFGDPGNLYLPSMAVFDGKLYVGTFYSPEGDNTGGELWSCTLCDGSDWSEVTAAKGFGDPNNRAIMALFVYNQQLFAATTNSVSGMEVWRSIDGQNWQPANEKGFGTSDNRYPYWNNAQTIFKGALYLGSVSNGLGGKVWIYHPSVIKLPLLIQR